MSHEAWVTRALSGAGDEEAFAHLDRCPSCREEWENLRRLEGELRKAAPSVPQDDLWAKRTVLRARPGLRPAGGEKARGRWGTLAALLLACAGLGTGLALLPPSAPPRAAEAGDVALLWDVDRDNGTLALLNGAESLAAEAEASEDSIGESGAGEVGGGGSHG